MNNLVVAYLQIHGNGTAVEVKCEPHLVKTVIEKAEKKGTTFVLPGQPIPMGVKLLKNQPNRATRRLMARKFKKKGA